MSELENKNGVFKADLMRTFRQLKESRAESVSEDVEIIYKRRIVVKYYKHYVVLVRHISQQLSYAGDY